MFLQVLKMINSSWTSLIFRVGNRQHSSSGREPSHWVKKTRQISGRIYCRTTFVNKCERKPKCCTSAGWQCGDTCAVSHPGKEERRCLLNLCVCGDDESPRADVSYRKHVLALNWNKDIGTKTKRYTECVCVFVRMCVNWCMCAMLLMPLRLSQRLLILVASRIWITAARRSAAAVRCLITLSN